MCIYEAENLNIAIDDMLTCLHQNTYKWGSDQSKELIDTLSKKGNNQQVASVNRSCHVQFKTI